MKKKIHPTYYPEATITCACGNVITVGSTKPEMQIEICQACHPFYTGKKKVIDTTGRVDRFKKRVQQATTLKETKAEIAKKKKERLAKAAKEKKNPTKKISKKKLKKTK